MSANYAILRTILMLAACMLGSSSDFSFAGSGTICGAAAGPNCLSDASMDPPIPTSVTLASGTEFKTTFPEPNKMHVAITPAPGEADTTHKIYFALYFMGKLYFEKPDGNFNEYAGGSVPALFTNAQTECRNGGSFSFSYSFPSLPSFTTLSQVVPGAIFLAGFGTDEYDMLNNGKFAILYTIPIPSR